MTIDEAITAWLADLSDTHSSADTVRSYRTAIASFQRWLRADPRHVQALDELTLAHLRAYVAALVDRRLDDRTLHQYVGVLTRWLASLVDGGALPGIPNGRGKLLSPDGVRLQLAQLMPKAEPAVAPRVPDLRRLPAYYDEQVASWLAARGGRLPSSEEPAMLRAWLNLHRNRALIATIYASGGRLGEVLGLDVDQVRRHGKIQPVTDRIRGKGRKRRPLRLDDMARRWIAEYLVARQPYFPEARALFISHGPRGKGERLSDVSAWKAVKEAAEALAEARAAEGADDGEVRALLDVSPHTLRHFLAQAMLDEGADYKDLAAILGHSSAVVTEQYYARLDDERMMEIVDTFAPPPARSFRASPSGTPGASASGGREGEDGSREGAEADRNS